MSGQIDTVMLENRVFPSPKEFASKAAIGSMKAYEELYERAKADELHVSRQRTAAIAILGRWPRVIV